VISCHPVQVMLLRTGPDRRFICEDADGSAFSPTTSHASEPAKYRSRESGVAVRSLNRVWFRRRSGDKGGDPALGLRPKNTREEEIGKPTEVGEVSKLATCIATYNIPYVNTLPNCCYLGEIVSLTQTRIGGLAPQEPRPRPAPLVLSSGRALALT